MAKDKKINRMFITLWFSFLLKGREIIPDVKIKRRKETKLDHCSMGNYKLNSSWPVYKVLSCPSELALGTTAQCPRQNFTTSFARRGTVSLQVFPPRFFSLGLYGARVRGKKRNMLPPLFHIYCSWPTKKQPGLWARTPSHNPLP